jgi:hypothetical protein
MPPNQKDNPFFFEADLDVDNLTKALSKGEKAYLAMADGMGSLTDALEDHSRKEDEAAKKAKKHAQDEEKRANKRSFFARGRKKMSKGFLGILRREKDAAGGLGISLKALGGLIGGATILGLIGKAVSSYLTFHRQIASLNTTLSGTPRLMNVAAGAVQGLTGYLDLSREELVQIAKSLNVVALEVDKLPGSRKIFRGIMMDTVHLAKSMDVSAQSVSDLYSTFLRVYKLPHHSLRGISASMKFIQEQTGISGEELMTFGKSLRTILAQMIGATGKTKAQATKDLLAMAGVFKKAGVDATQMSSIFAQAMDKNSDAGQKFLQFIGPAMGKSSDEIRKMLQEGKFLDVAGGLSEALRRAGPKAIQEYQSYYGELTGLGVADMLALSKLTTKNFKDFAKQNDLAAKKQALHRKRAMRLQHSLSRMWNTMKRAFEKLWLSVGRILTNLVAKIAKFMIPKIIAAVKWLDQWFNRFSRGGGAQFNKWIEQAWQWMRKHLWPALKDIGKLIAWVAKKVKEGIEWWNTLTGTEKKIVAWAAAIGIALAALSGPGSAIVLLVAAVVAAKKAIDELYEADFRMLREKKRWMDRTHKAWMKEQFGRKQLEATFRSGFDVKATGDKKQIVAKLASYMKQGLITSEGKVGPAAEKLWRAGTEAGDRAHAQKVLTAALKKMTSQAAFGRQHGLKAEHGYSGLTGPEALRLAAKAAGASIPSPKKVAPTPVPKSATQKTAPGTVPTPTVEPPPPPVINVKADSKTRNMLLEAIRRQLETMHQASTIRRAGAGGSAAKGALG